MKNKMLKETINLSKALIEDGISYLGMPVSTAKWFQKAIMPKRLLPEYYHSPTPEIIQELYVRKIDDLLQLKDNSHKSYLPVMVEVDNTQLKIQLSSIEAYLKENTFVLDDEFEAASNHFFSSYIKMLWIWRKKYFDGELARLESFSIENNTLKLSLQPVRYNTVCKTHMCLDAPLSGNEQDTLRFRAHKERGLQALNKSRLANALGVNTLLFTADGELILQRRSKNVVVFHSLFGPPSSGDFEADDFRPSGTSFKTIPFLRESKEELHIHSHDIKGDSIEFLGITRELTRGGKPEMFFLAFTNLNREKVKRLRKNARDKWESSNIIFWPFGTGIIGNNMSDDQRYSVRKSFDDLLKAHKTNMSLSLLSALALWQKRLSL